MAGANVTFEIKDEAVRAHLQGLVNRFENPTQLMRIFGQVVVKSVRKNFDEGGRPSQWPESERVTFQGGKTLILQGMKGGLMQSINYQASRDEVRIGTPKIYGAVHQFGYGPNNIPARPYLMVQDEDWDTMIKKAELWFVKNQQEATV